ncbi:putative SnoaL-like aldol condensation-catalyzing enzyme [Altererythrobacter atlanticus]|uniref:SnoaL-like domain protein n=1 Tax=Croceibacterium atlanticum TaxID=1267766 RepID=A0A0F7KXJ1_9SPHN|nr:nuclear transport factor 2 family protein [Croceibacterium atlanticum]AKH43922.1 SnoaL-like domain protein [Croceibacterium atlanticum]MBB5733628.1 putative SnoaL-like aldol condensation-catalyzing enzyme [Croceibacterium atlanticum]
MRSIMLAATALLAITATAAAGEEKPLAYEKPQIPEDHESLIASDDPQLAANKRLVYDMYRIVLQAGLADRAHEYIAVDYVQHNPNAAQGLDGLIDYVRSTRPERPIKDKLELPLIHLMAEGDYVTTAFVRPEKDAEGRTYYATWFDLYRIEDGKIAEHWDPMLKSDPKIDPNDRQI